MPSVRASDSDVVSSVPLPDASTTMLGRSPACGPAGFKRPCCLVLGLKWPPAEENATVVAASHVPTAWM